MAEPEFFRRTRGYAWNADIITAAHAARLLAEARAAGESDPGAGPVADGDGVRFVAGRVAGVGGMWVWLHPVARESVPPEVLERVQWESP